MNKTRRMKPLTFTFPISRVDDEQRVVEGYAFVNETVPGEGGIRLKRAAMVAATADYVQNGTCREIHQPSAAGKPLDVQWDDKGAYLRMKVVDDQAWRKVKEGVYKGFSVGVTPKVMRGQDVTVCEWWDTSLIDRGKDKDALFTVWRSGEVDPNAEVEVEQLERATFAEYLEGYGPSDLRGMALDYLWNSLVDIQWGDGTPEEKESAVRETCGQFTEFMVGAVATGVLPQIMEPDADDEIRSAGLPEITRALIDQTLAATDEIAVTRAFVADAEAEAASHQAAIARAAELETTISTLTNERDEQATELARVQGDHTAAIERIATLENQPARTAPVRVPADFKRTFEATPNPDAEAIQTLKTELAEISRSVPSPDEKVSSQRIGRISQIKSKLREFGESV